MHRKIESRRRATGGFLWGLMVPMLVWGAAGLGLIGACSDDSGSGPGKGQEGEACFEDGTCEVGLECNEERICVVPDACIGQNCSGHGTCVVTDGQASCECEDGYHAEGLACLEDTADTCDGVDCSGHGTCVVTDGQAACECEDGYHAEGLACLEDAADTCDGVDCSGHGTCVVTDGQAACECEDGYHADELSCVSDDQTIGPLPTDSTPVADGTLFVAPDGEGTDCTEAHPCDLWTVLDVVEPGDVVFLRDGVYDIDHSWNLRVDGTEDHPIVFESYPGEQAILDGASNNVGDDVFLRIYAHYNVFRRIEIRNMPRQGLYIRGCHNLVDGIESHHNGLTGIQIVSPYDEFPYGAYGSYNVLRNCIVHDNYDEGTAIPGFNDGDNADGVSISSGEGNVIKHCLSYHNSDDGFDCWRSTHTTFAFSMAYSNGYGTNGNGNGFKAGGQPPSEGAVVAHCIAYENVKRGFTYNSGVDVTFSYNTSYHNGAVEFASGDTTTLDHNIALAADGGRLHSSSGTFDDNSWNREGDVTFISTDPDSSDFLHPTSGGGFEDIGAYADVSR
ncbi:MAG: right-handed parallel beta-helix repeat-containing protein [Deltaproteobacteria bacterium]|nr:right-handed parallel beta-helix repeat-containing protein [Deltaproteobacteria bacterium]